MTANFVFFTDYIKNDLEFFQIKRENIIFITPYMERSSLMYDAGITMDY